MKEIQHALWQTAKAARDEKLARRCRLEFATDGWDKSCHPNDFLASPDADICLGLDEWEDVEGGLGEWESGPLEAAVWEIFKGRDEEAKLT
jgi:hypothetical protein